MRKKSRGKGKERTKREGRRVEKDEPHLLRYVIHIYHYTSINVTP